MTTPTSRSSETALESRRLRRLDRLRLAMIVALAVQLLLGMANNLWLTQPKKNLEHASPAALLSAHTTWAYVLIALAIWIFVAALRLRRGRYLAPATLGLVGVLLAYTSGLVYFETESNTWSFFMALGFTLAATSYALAGRKWSRL